MNFLTSELISWYQSAKRPLPWREKADPYFVWLSEIILQQTRVAQGLPYYVRFIEKYPDVSSLAAASEADVLKLWEGLGYYSRARNLLHCAKQVKNEFGGVFPNSYPSLLKLKGIGPYTAAAIASICFREPAPVVDGNVFRVFTRLYAYDGDITKHQTRSFIFRQLQEIIPKDHPGDFNQAMMELGATVCTPTQPDCVHCPVRSFCEAAKTQKQTEYPVKSKKVKVRNRYFHYLVAYAEEQWVMKERLAGDIWQGLYDFPMVEAIDNKDSVELKWPVSKTIGPIKHLLTHQHVYAYFHLLSYDNHEAIRRFANECHGILQSTDQMNALPKPKLVINFLNLQKNR